MIEGRHVAHDRSDRSSADASEDAVRVLQEKGVRLWIENGALRFRAPKGVMTADDIVLLRQLAIAHLPLPSLREDANPLQPHVTGEAHPQLAPLSFNQLAHRQLRGPSARYRPQRQIISLTLIRGEMSEICMQEALALVAQRHHGLRTQIVAASGEAMQQVVRRDSCSLAVMDLADMPLHARHKEVRREITFAMDAELGYALFRPSLLRLGKTERILILAMDHMISDGASRSILENEVFSAYEELVTGRDVSLPPVQMQSSDYAIWQRTALAGYLSAHDFAPSAWVRTHFPADMRDQAQRGWAQIRFTLDLKIRGGLENLARRSGTTLVMVVLAAYAAFAMRWCNVSDMLVQVMSHGRTNRQIENTIGYVAHPLYLHVCTGRKSTFTELLQLVTAEFCRACERPDFYYSYTLSPRPEFTRNTLFNWVPSGKRAMAANSLAANDSIVRSPVDHDDSAALAELNLDAEPAIAFHDSGGEINGILAFAQGRFTPSAMTRFTIAFKGLLEAVSASPRWRFQDIAIS